MKVAYIIGPYRAPTKDDVQANIDRARTLAEKLWRDGYAVICPHMNTAHLDGIVEDEVFLAGDLEILRRCDEAWVLPGYESSRGSIGEVMHCQIKGIPLVFMD